MQQQDKKLVLNLLGWQDFVHVFANLKHLTLFSANIQEEDFFYKLLNKMHLRQLKLK
jgi:hypothetical protein